MKKNSKYFFLTDGLLFAMASFMVFSSKFILDLTFRGLHDFNLWAISYNQAVFYTGVFGFLTIGLGLEWKGREYKSPIFIILYSLYIVVILLNYFLDLNKNFILVFLNVISNILTVSLLGIFRFHFTTKNLILYSFSIFICPFIVKLLDLSYFGYHALLSIIFLLPVSILSTTSFRDFNNFFSAVFKTGIFIYFVNLIHSYFISVDKIYLLKTVNLSEYDILLVNNFAYVIYPSGLIGTLLLAYYKKGHEEVLSIPRKKLMIYSILFPMLFYVICYVCTHLIFSKIVLFYITITAIFYSIIQFNNLVFFTIENRKNNFYAYAGTFLLYLCIYYLWKITILIVLPVVLFLLLIFQYLLIKNKNKKCVELH